MIEKFSVFLIGMGLLCSVIFVGASGEAPAYGDVGIGTQNVWTSTTSPSAAITQKVWGRAIKITGLADGCLELSSSLVISSGDPCGTGSGSGFSTTSNDYWKDQRNFFSTTSADYWDTQQTARTADDLTNNSIEDLSDVTAITENLGDLLYWNGSAWADIATSTLYGASTGGYVLMWNGSQWQPSATATCVQITGSADLCDGNDGGGAGGSGSSKWATSSVDVTAISPAGATKVGIGTSTPGVDLVIASASAAPYVRIQGVNDGDNFGALELWSNSGTIKKWQFAHQNTGNFTFAHNNGGGWTNPLTIEDDNDILIGSNSLNFPAGGTTGSNYKFAQDGDDLFTLQRNGGTDTNYSLLQIKAPSANPTEATLALMTDAGGGNYSFMDVYQQRYATESQWGLRQHYAGTYTPTPFVIDYFNGTTKFPQMVILPSGQVGFGVATSSIPNGVGFYVGTTTSNSVFAGGNVGLGTTSPYAKLSVVGETVARNFTATSTAATSTFPTLNVSTAMDIFGMYGTTWPAFCQAITGGSGLCDGTDATGGGGSDVNWTFASNKLGLYPSTTSLDVWMGSSATSTAPFWFDVSATTTYIGNGGTGDSILQMGPTNKPWTLGYDDTDGTWAIASSTTLGTNNVITIQPDKEIVITDENSVSGWNPAWKTVGFTYSTTTWSGTTTILLGPAYAAQTVRAVYCETTTGTLGVSLYDGTNRANYIPTASTTINLNSYSSNNTFTAGESRRVDIGTPASTPVKIACTFGFTYTAD